MQVAIAPLGVASPQIVESVSENEEDLPVAMDCTTLALVDAAQSNPASLRDAARTLLAENQDCSVEPKDCLEVTCSAASVAENEFCLGSAIANQIQGQVEQGYSATFTVENSVSGVEIKTVDEGESSLRVREFAIDGNRQDCDSLTAALVPNPEKWSHEAIVARSQIRPERMQKLKLAGNSAQNPGFDFLHECWNDDPALQIVIKKLLAKCPQWGITIVDGVLIDWNAKLK